MLRKPTVQNDLPELKVEISSGFRHPCEIRQRIYKTAGKGQRLTEDRAGTGKYISRWRAACATLGGLIHYHNEYS